jgi:hypothetical protein
MWTRGYLFGAILGILLGLALAAAGSMVLRWLIHRV